MDQYGLPIEGYPLSTSLPLGFAMALGMNEAAMQGYAKLSETEKEHLIMKCKDARSKEEMQKIVNSLAPQESLNNLREEEKEQLL